MIVNSKQSAKDAACEIIDMQVTHKYLQVSIKKATRTNLQNAWIYKAYSMLEKQGDMTAAEYRNYCKYTFGLPILFASDNDTSTAWRIMLKSIPYEGRLLAMEQMQVTSLFSADEMGRYIDAICKAFNDKQLPEKQE